VAEKAAWVPHTAPRSHGGSGAGDPVDRHVRDPRRPRRRGAGELAVDVDRIGEAVVVGQDTGLMVNPDGVRHQIHGNVVQSTSRVLKRLTATSATHADHAAAVPGNLPWT
jgi:nicotinate dehydrogenase subunit B